MGLMTESELESGKVKWIAIDQTTGQFKCNQKLYPAVKGKLLGFDTHEYTSKFGKAMKLDIYLEDKGEVYDVQFGLYTGLTWKLLNMLASVADQFNGNDLILFRANKDEEGYFNIAVTFNGKPCKWKFKWEEAGLKGLEKEALAARQSKMIDKWTAMFIEKKRYEVSAVEPEEYTAEDEMPAIGLEDDIPF